MSIDWHALGGGELVGVSGLADLYAGGDPRGGGGAQGVGVEALRGADASGALASVAERDGDGVVGMSGLNPDGAGDFLAVEFEFDDVFGGDVEALRHRGTDLDGVVPGELVHRLGEFLQPAVVGELSVVDGGVAADVELDGVGVSFGTADGAQSTVPLRGQRSSDANVVPSIHPSCSDLRQNCSKSRAGVLLLPVGADEIVSGGVGLAGEQRDEFQRALAVIERSDQRLDDADGSVVGAGIAPGFEFVRRVDVPLAEFGGFVLIEAVVHAQRNLAVLQRVGEVQIGGRIVGRIAAEDDQQIDFAGVHVGDEIFDRFGLIDRIRIDWVGVEDGLADVAQLGIDRMGESMNGRRLMISGDDKL